MALFVEIGKKRAWNPVPDPLSRSILMADTYPMYCLGCGYNLRRLAGSKCPECGREFDVADAQTWGERKAYKYKWLVWALPWGLCLLSVLPTCYVMAKVAFGSEPRAVILSGNLVIQAVVLLLLWIVLYDIGAVRRTIRVGCVFIFCVLLNLTFLTHWPADLLFRFNRSVLNRAAAQLQGGHFGAHDVGVYRITGEGRRVYNDAAQRQKVAVVFYLNSGGRDVILP